MMSLCSRDDWTVPWNFVTMGSGWKCQFGPKRKEERKTKKDWRKLDNDELNDLHSSPNIIRVVSHGALDGGRMRQPHTDSGGETRREETTHKSKT
jgi:hypothetical protein